MQAVFNDGMLRGKRHFHLSFSVSSLLFFCQMSSFLKARTKTSRIAHTSIIRGCLFFLPFSPALFPDPPVFSLIGMPAEHRLFWLLFPSFYELNTDNSRPIPPGSHMSEKFYVPFQSLNLMFTQISLLVCRGGHFAAT